MKVICEHYHECTKKDCVHLKPHLYHRSECSHSLCSYIPGKEDIITTTKCIPAHIMNWKEKIK